MSASTFHQIATRVNYLSVTVKYSLNEKRLENAERRRRRRRNFHFSVSGAAVTLKFDQGVSEKVSE